jgi:hypothetical protein
MSTEKSLLEKRVELLEAKLRVIEQRRARLMPPELLEDKEIVDHLARSMQNAATRIKSSIAVNKLNADFDRLKRKKLAEMEDAARLQEREDLAEIAAAVEYYERTGDAPPGYNIIDDEPPSRVF